MIGNLKPYAEYKEVGLPWLGQLPRHWGSRRMKLLFKEQVQKGFPKEPLLAATQSKGVVRKEDYGSRTVIAMNGLENLKLVEVGDFVISLRSFQGGIEVSHARGIISPAYTVLRPRNFFDPGYFKLYFKSAAFVRSMTLFVTGIREGQNIDYERLSRAFMPLPPPDEQAAIVRFLDWANGRLERAIRAKHKVIGLLNEEKQAIIHRAVTRGLNHQIKLKTSDVDWAGGIPQEWSEYPLRRLATCDNSGSYGRDPSPTLQELPVATTAQIDRNGHFNVGKMPRRGFTSAEINRFCCKPGDILVVKSSGSAANVISGKCGIVERDTPAFVYSNFLARFIANEALIKPHYLYLLLTSYITRERVKRMVSTTTYPNLRMGEYRGALLPVPPLEVQQQILEAVHIEVSSVEKAALRLEREIELLREYRTRLVADVVTGKLDVREAAAGLPDEVTRGTVEDAADLGEDLDTADEEATA
jgi:type I restriction enzyme S subunit